MTRRWFVAVVLCALAIVVLAFAAPASAQQAAAAQITTKIDGDYGPHLPPRVYSAQTYGGKVDVLIEVLHYFMILLFVAWGIFFVYCLVRFRRRGGHQAVVQPIKAKVSKWAEIGVAVFEAALLLGLAIPVWGSVKREFPAETEHPQHVRVVAEQFAWNFHYPGPDGVFGRRGPQFIDMATNPLGKDPSDAQGADDVVSGELHIVKERPVIAEITSKDVIHSFFIPVMRVKQDAIPGMRIPIWFKAGVSGNYEVACAQLCGNNHYSMRALLVVHETQKELDDWIESKKPQEFDEDELN